MGGRGPLWSASMMPIETPGSPPLFQWFPNSSDPRICLAIGSPIGRVTPLMFPSFWSVCLSLSWSATVSFVVSCSVSKFKCGACGACCAVLWFVWSVVVGVFGVALAMSTSSASVSMTCPVLWSCCARPAPAPTPALLLAPVPTLAPVAVAACCAA